MEVIVVVVLTSKCNGWAQRITKLKPRELKLLNFINRVATCFCSFITGTQIVPYTTSFLLSCQVLQIITHIYVKMIITMVKWYYAELIILSQLHNITCHCFRASKLLTIETSLTDLYNSLLSLTNLVLV